MVKICGITNREDAIAAIEAGASALGFNFYPKSPRYIEPERAAALIAGLPAGIWKAGVFVNESAERVSEIARIVGLDIVQVIGQPVDVAGRRVWQTVYVDEGFRVADLDAITAEAALLDAPSGSAY